MEFTNLIDCLTSLFGKNDNEVNMDKVNELLDVYAHRNEHAFNPCRKFEEFEEMLTNALFIKYKNKEVLDLIYSKRLYNFTNKLVAEKYDETRSNINPVLKEQLISDNIDYLSEFLGNMQPHHITNEYGLNDVIDCVTTYSSIKCFKYLYLNHTTELFDCLNYYKYHGLVNSPEILRLILASASNYPLFYKNIIKNLFRSCTTTLNYKVYAFLREQFGDEEYDNKLLNVLYKYDGFGDIGFRITKHIFKGYIDAEMFENELERYYEVYGYLYIVNDVSIILRYNRTFKLTHIEYLNKLMNIISIRRDYHEDSRFDVVYTGLMSSRFYQPFRLMINCMNITMKLNCEMNVYQSNIKEIKNIDEIIRMSEELKVRRNILKTELMNTINAINNLLLPEERLQNDKFDENDYKKWNKIYLDSVMPRDM